MPITKDTPLSDIIHDFVHSDDPKFAGKSKEDRIKMAKGAFYGMQKEDLDEGIMKTPAEWKAEREKAHPGWNKHETDDFQKRDGDYPKSNVPDSIEHQNHGMVFTFKNTDEKTAAAFAKTHMAKHGLKHGKITTRQDGDYHDDWVQAHVHHPEVKESVEEKKNESTIDLIAAINLIGAISEGDTIAASNLFSELLMSRVSSLIEERRKEVAQGMFAESNTIKVAIANKRIKFPRNKHANRPKHESVELIDAVNESAATKGALDHEKTEKYGVRVGDYVKINKDHKLYPNSFAHVISLAHDGNNIEVELHRKHQGKTHVLDARDTEVQD